MELYSCDLATVLALCEEHHAYGSGGSVAAYSFAVFEEGRAVAGFAWLPPPPAAARSVCPEAPEGVLALSRMVAVPKDQRKLKHISKPLKHQMFNRIDRTRWPVLVTYSDESLGHTGFVYKCSKWTPTVRNSSPIYRSTAGNRRSQYANGAFGERSLLRAGTKVTQRWENWITPPGTVRHWMDAAGWRRVPTGKRWASGNPAYKFIRVDCDDMPS